MVLLRGRIGTTSIGRMRHLCVGICCCLFIYLVYIYVRLREREGLSPLAAYGYPFFRKWLNGVKVYLVEGGRYVYYDCLLRCMRVVLFSPLISIEV